MKLEAQHLKFLLNLLGDRRVVNDPSQLKDWASDWTKPAHVDAACVVFPNSTEEVSKILAYCFEHRLAVVPSGGRTGLAGGAVAAKGEIILSLSRMNKLLNIDPVGLTVEVEAGMTTQALQESVAAHNLFYGIDLSARGSSQIGGNIATNAGGLKYIRYGGTREQVLGLEVVLADGRVMDLQRALRKNNSGYNLTQLFVGSEGTLGVITKAILKVERQPKDLKVACLSVEDPAKISEILRLSHKENLCLSAFEFFTDKALQIELKMFPNFRSPFTNPSPYYVLIEIEENLGSLELSDFLEKLFEADCIVDGVLASSTQEFKDLWALRENITESLSHWGHVRKNDISVNVKDLATFFQKATEFEKDKDKAIELVLFGHVGDGNIHVNYSGDKKLSHEEFVQKAKVMEKKVFSLIKELKGSISAEHGIGLLKKADLSYTVSELELAHMKEIKKVFDPRNILNPAKIFDL